LLHSNQQRVQSGPTKPSKREPNTRGDSLKRLTLLLFAVSLLIIVITAAYYFVYRKSPQSDSGTAAEVQLLQQEIDRLKAAQSPTAPKPETSIENPDYQNFLRLSRRLVVAIQSGIQYEDFHQRAVDVLASATEAARLAPSPTERNAITSFALAVTDANDLWHYEAITKKEVNWLLVYDKDGDSYSAEQLCSDRWDNKVSELVEAYSLDFKYGDPVGVGKDYWTILIDPSIPKILTVCVDRFQTLDTYSSKTSPN
jgi:hypothetical protein